MVDELETSVPEEPIEAELSQSEIRAIETEVRSDLRKEDRKKKREALKAKLKKELQQAAGIEEGFEEVYLDLAKHSDRIIINGVSYMHGLTHRVPASLARDFRWIMQSTHWHQAEIDGKPKRYYTSERNIKLSPHGVVTTAGGLRV